MLAKVSFAMSEKDSALRVIKAVAVYLSFHRNLELDFINGKQKTGVEDLESVIKPAATKAPIESKVEVDRSDVKLDFLGFIAYVETMAIIRDEHCHVADYRTTADSVTKNTGKSSDVGGRSSGLTSKLT
jgi:hypothetical protein